jgi:hypothetical protein
VFEQLLEFTRSPEFRFDHHSVIYAIYNHIGLDETSEARRSKIQFKLLFYKIEDKKTENEKLPPAVMKIDSLVCQC